MHYLALKQPVDPGKGLVATAGRQFCVLRAQDLRTVANQIEGFYNN